MERGSDRAGVNGQTESEAVAARLDALYVTCCDRFVMSRGGAIFVPRRKDRTLMLAPSTLVKHVCCEYAVSVFAGREGSRFLCLDVDHGGAAMVRRIMEAMTVCGIKRERIHPSTSGGKGYHVEVFFDRPVSCGMIRRFHRRVLIWAGATPAQVEGRPTCKQSIKLPLSVHHKTGNRCWFLDRETLEPIESMDYVYSIEPMPAKRFEALVQALPFEEDAQQAVVLSGGRQPVALPCNEVFAPLTEQGTRHHRMVRMAVYLRYHGADAAVCADMLTAWYAQQAEGLIQSSYAEVMREIRAIVKWVQGERFVLAGHAGGQVTFFGMELQRVMSRGKRCERQVYFLILLLQKMGRTQSQQEMSRVLGITRNAVTGAVKGLAQAGEIEVRQGEARRTRKGYFVRKQNRYGTTSQRGGMADTVWQLQCLYVTVDARLALERFHLAYYGAIHKMFGGSNLKKLLQPKEYGQYLEAMGGLERGDDAGQAPQAGGDK